MSSAGLRCDREIKRPDNPARQTTSRAAHRRLPRGSSPRFGRAITRISRPSRARASWPRREPGGMCTASHSLSSTMRREFHPPGPSARPRTPLASSCVWPGWKAIGGRRSSLVASGRELSELRAPWWPPELQVQRTSNLEPMSSRSSLMFLSVNGTGQSYGVDIERWSEGVEPSAGSCVGR